MKSCHFQRYPIDTSIISPCLLVISTPLQSLIYPFGLWKIHPLSMVGWLLLNIPNNGCENWYIYIYVCVYIIYIYIYILYIYPLLVGYTMGSTPSSPNIASSQSPFSFRALSPRPRLRSPGPALPWLGGRNINQKKTEMLHLCSDCNVLCCTAVRMYACHVV